MGVGLVHYTADDGTLLTIREAFTSAAAVNPFARVAAGRSAFLVSDPLALAALLDSLDRDGSAGMEADGGEGIVKEILPLLWLRLVQNDILRGSQITRGQLPS